jgi:hypothetical protein
VPHPIVVASGQPGVIGYTLGKRESFTLLGLSALLKTVNGGFSDTILLDCRTSIGGIIYRQTIDLGPNGPTFYSLAPFAEPMWIVPDSIDNGFPQQNNADQAFYTVRMAPVTLTPGCTVSMIAASGAAYPDVDPLTTLDADASWLDLHLWVQGSSRRPTLPPPPPPLLAHVV